MRPAPSDGMVSGSPGPPAGCGRAGGKADLRLPRQPQGSRRSVTSSTLSARISTSASA